MKRSLIISAFLLVLLIAGCASNPVAAPAPQDPQAASQDRDRDRDKDRDRGKDQERDKDRDRQDKAVSCPAGQHLATVDGRASCVRD